MERVKLAVAALILVAAGLIIAAPSLFFEWQKHLAREGCPKIGSGLHMHVVTNENLNRYKWDGVRPGHIICAREPSED